MIEYVMALVVKKNTTQIDLSGTGEWLMVEHIKRGWELPGGKPRVNEVFEESIKREVLEETGLIVKIQKGPEIWENGLVYLMHPLDENLTLRVINDPMIKSAEWHSKPPENLAWGIKELKDIIELFSLK